MTYFIGPGYPSDHFKFVKLEPVQLLAPSANSEDQEELNIGGQVSSRSDNDHGRQMNENVPAESGGGQEAPEGAKSEINDSVLIANNNSDTSRNLEQDREQTYLLYFKSEYERMV